MLNRSSNRCTASKHISGYFFVKSECSDGTQPVPIIGTRADARHIVHVATKMIYPATIRCQGTVVSSPQHIEFDTTQKHRWETNVRVSDTRARIVGDVGVTSLQPNPSRLQMIDVEVEVVFPSRQTTKKAVVQIEVNS